MIKLATVFSGIGAIEHALQRMGLEHKIVFACDNGDLDIFVKEIGMDMDLIGRRILKRHRKNNRYYHCTGRTEESKDQGIYQT